MVGVSPGAADEEITCTPEVLPCSADCTVATERFSISSAFTCEIEPVTELFFCTPYPTTTTSFNVCVSSFKETFREDLMTGIS